MHLVPHGLFQIQMEQIHQISTIIIGYVKYFLQQFLSVFDSLTFPAALCAGFTPNAACWLALQHL